MEHRKLWFQGRTPLTIPKCDGKPEFTCPESKRIAAEYMRDYFTLTNVLNPNIHYDNLGVETWLYKELLEAKVDDILWMVLVPPRHNVLDVFLYNEETFTEHSSLTSMGGITLSVVTGEFEAADDDGNCALKGNVEDHGTIVMPATADPEPQFVQDNLNKLTDHKTWLGVGIRIDALPANKTLANIVGKVAVGAHAVGYDAQTFM